MKNTKSIKGVLIDVRANTIKEHIHKYNVENIEESLEKIYSMLECTCIDIQTRKIGSKYFDIYLDDEGLWKENRIISIYTTSKDKIVETIVGNVFICNHDGEGGMKSLTQEEIDMILNSVLPFKHKCIHTTI